MKLHFAHASPYARKVRVVAEELGLSGRIELVVQAVSPIAPIDALNQANPLGKIPALELDDGSVLFDSRVIADYLNDLGGGRLLPQETGAVWDAKAREALADGICDALVGVRYETFLRPEHARWDEWIRQQLNKAMRAMSRLDETVDRWGGDLTIANIAIGCALDYTDFRFSELGWRNGRSKLANWHEQFASRPAMLATKPA